MSRRMIRFMSWVAVLLLAGVAQAQDFRVLVTNDDGVDGVGMAVLVDELTKNPKLDVTVVSPLTNQSGTGDSFTTAPLNVSSSMTAFGFPVTAVDGFPADSVLFGVHEVLPEPPDIVVSGINFGQNITREIAGISGTVGAALTAGRLGIIGVAVSQGIFPADPNDYRPAAIYAANLVEDIRRKRGTRRKFESKVGLDQRIILNVNFPQCGAGSVRWVELVVLGVFSTVTGYTVVDPNTGTFQANVSIANPFVSNCMSTLEKPLTDLQAMNNGFASVTPLNPDLTVDSRLKKFRFVRRIRFE